jgi:hypothetical protein
MTYAEVQAALLADGFSEGLPAGCSEGPTLNAEAAEAARCAACGRVGLHCAPITGMVSAAPWPWWSVLHASGRRHA